MLYYPLHIENDQKFIHMRIRIDSAQKYQLAEDKVINPPNYTGSMTSASMGTAEVVNFQNHKEVEDRLLVDSWPAIEAVDKSTA
jgi:hypothetical protein